SVQTLDQYRFSASNPITRYTIRYRQILMANNRYRFVRLNAWQATYQSSSSSEPDQRLERIDQTCPASDAPCASTRFQSGQNSARTWRNTDATEFQLLFNPLLAIATDGLSRQRVLHSDTQPEQLKSFSSRSQTGKCKKLHYCNSRSTSDGRVSPVPQTLDFRNQRWDTSGIPASIPQQLCDMRREENRWQSFHLPDASFTAAHLVSVTDLAADGFFYLQETDRVKCAFCKGVLKGWKAGEQVREAHRRHFSTCPFVLFVEVGNVPREHREPEGASRSAKLVEAVQCSDQIIDEAVVMVNGDWSMKLVAELPPIEAAGLKEWALATRGLCSPTSAGAVRVVDDELVAVDLIKHPQLPVSSEVARSACSERALRELSALQHSLESEPSSVTAKHADFESYQTRSQSLHSAFVQQPVYLLAKAGFFYSKAERATCCFSCGLRVNDWSCSDDVWIEHARWSPRCPHVLLERGSDFVRTVHRLSPPVQHPTCAASARRRTALVQSGSTVSASFATVDESVAPTAVRSSRVDQSLAVTPGVEFRVEAKDINARADLPVLRLLTQLGFSALQVKLFTELHLRQRGDDFATSELFLDFMLSESRRMRKQSQDPEAFFESRMSQIRESLNQQPRHRDTIDWKTCKVCMDNEVNVMLLDCGHLNICSPCANSVTSCPICTAYIRGTVLIKI
ncbi:hypothetical protein BOX15_Mlig006323g2, partial [Macrostomum lignano]